jgi:hypothetical protein
MNGGDCNARKIAMASWSRRKTKKKSGTPDWDNLDPVDAHILHDSEARFGPGAAKRMWQEMLDTEQMQRERGWWFLGGTSRPPLSSRLMHYMLARLMLEAADCAIVRLLPDGRVDSPLTAAQLFERVQRAQEDEHVARLPAEQRALLGAFYESRRRGLLELVPSYEEPVRILRPEAFPSGPETTLGHLRDFLDKQDRGEGMS